MRHIYWIAICLFFSQEIKAQSGKNVGAEQPRLIFLSNHESRERSELYLFDGKQPDDLVKVNSPLPSGCPGKRWYERLIRSLMSDANASITDPLAGCFRGIFDFWVTPDGRQVLYTTATKKLGFKDLHLVSMDNPGHFFVINKLQQEHHTPYVAAISPDSQSFIYFGKTKGELSNSLYLVDINNPLAEKRVATATETGKDIISARFSPDGSKVAYYQVGENPRNGKILLVDAAQLGRQPVVIAEDFDFATGQYRFSAYGSYIVYVGRLDALREYRLVLVDTANAGHRITIDRRTDAIIYGVHLSPNRRILLYDSFEPKTQRSTTHVVDLATLDIPFYSEPEISEMPTARQRYTAPFSPDSQTFIVRSELPDGGKQLHKFSVNTPDIRIPVSPIVPRYDFGHSIVYTPDGQRIIYRADLESQGPYGGLYLSDLDRPINSDRISITTEQSVHSFALSLDGNFVAYVAEEDDPDSVRVRNLYLIDLLNRNEAIRTSGSASSALAHHVLPFRVEFLPPGPGYRE